MTQSLLSRRQSSGQPLPEFTGRAFHSAFSWSRSLLALAVGCALLASLSPAAAGELVKLSTRPDIKTTLFWHETPGATATLFVFPGGGGGFGKVVEDWPTSNNFLVRTSRIWAAEGFNLAIFGRPNDSEDLSYEDRTSDAHLQDVKAALEWVKAQGTAPIWVIGTSRGTISTVATLIAVREPRIAGGVVTSSVVGRRKSGALPKQDLAQIGVPMLVYHHELDGCDICKPHEVPAVLKGLKGAPVKKLMMVSGGANPTGSVCEGLHWHGFIGMERQAVSDISGWIRSPTN